jgi:hypothetical protein
MRIVGERELSVTTVRSDPTRGLLFDKVRSGDFFSGADYLSWSM